MSFSRIQPIGWVLNQRLTHVEITQLDIDHANAVDKTGDTITNAQINFDSSGVLNINSGASLNINNGSFPAINNAKLVVSALNGSGNGIEMNSFATLALGPQATAFIQGTLSCNGTCNLTGTTLIQGNNTIQSSNLTMTGTSRVKVASRVINRVVNSPAITGYLLQSVDASAVDPNAVSPVDFFIPFFTTNISNGNPIQRDVVSSLPFMTYDLDLPHNAVLNEIHIIVDPASGHANLPTNKPSISLISNVIATNTSSTVNGTDGSASVISYETPHLISITGLNLTINRTTTRYILRFIGESSTNALPNLNVYGAYTVCTITEMDEG